MVKDEKTVGLQKGECEGVQSNLTKEERKKAIKQSKKSATMSLEQFNKKSEVDSLDIMTQLFTLNLSGRSTGR